MSTLEDAIAEAFGEEVEVDPAPAAEEPQPEASLDDGTSEEKEEARSEPARDEKGRFVAKDADPDLEKYLERFGGDVDKALRAAVEADRMIGRQGQQMGELQKQLRELQESLSQPPEPQAPQITQETVDWFDDQIASRGPQAAAVWALQNDPAGPDGVFYGRAMEAWFDESPREAAAFQTRVEVVRATHALQAQQLPLYEQAAKQEFAAAWRSLQAEIPDLADPAIAESMLKAAEEAPEVLSGLQSGDPDDRKRVIRTLYRLAKFEEANRLAAQQGQQPPADAPQAPFVTSQQQHVEPERKSAGERWAEENLDPYLEQYMRTAFEEA